MPLNPGGSEGNEDGAADNEGPHCRNCHIGASACNQCHGAKVDGSPGWYFATRTGTGGTGMTKEYSYIGSSSETTPTKMPGGFGNPYMTQQYVHTSAVAATAVDAQCIDGGFSWPHRTLGANLLKDELYGVDYDGTRIYVGDTRDSTGFDFTNYGNVTFGTGAAEATFAHPYQTDLVEGIRADVLINPTPDAHTPSDAVGQVQNLDSACIDCHGDATFWNGDNKAEYYYSKTYLGGVVGGGWEVHLKGLP